MNKWEHTMVITRFVYDRTSSSNWSSKAGCLCKLRCDVKSSLFYAFLSRQHQEPHAWPGTPTVYTPLIMNFSVEKYRDIQKACLVILFLTLTWVGLVMVFTGTKLFRIVLSFSFVRRQTHNILHTCFFVFLFFHAGFFYSLDVCDQPLQTVNRLT